MRSLTQKLVTGVTEPSPASLAPGGGGVSSVRGREIWRMPGSHGWGGGDGGVSGTQPRSLSGIITRSGELLPQARPGTSP